MNHRTYLFVPGDEATMLAKAGGGHAKAMIGDLEDTVAPANQASARQTTAEWRRQRDDPFGPVDPDLSNPDRLEAEARDPKDIAFGSRAIIHPATSDEVETRRVVTRNEEALAAGEGHGSDGVLVDQAFVKRSRRVLALTREET